MSNGKDLSTVCGYKLCLNLINSKKTMNDRTGTERKKTKTWLKSMRKLRLLLTLTVVSVYYFRAAAGKFAVKPERFRFDGTSVRLRREDKSQIRQVQTVPGMLHCG